MHRSDTVLDRITRKVGESSCVFDGADKRQYDRWLKITGELCPTPRPSPELSHRITWDNRLIEERQGMVDMNYTVVHHKRLGGVLNYYDRRAA